MGRLPFPPPSSSGPGHRPFTPETRVQTPSGASRCVFPHTPHGMRLEFEPALPPEADENSDSAVAGRGSLPDVLLVKVEGLRIAGNREGAAR